MNTFTHILASINWVDVAMLALLIRIVFIGVKTGFVTELFKLLGVFCSVFIGLHFYTTLAALATKRVGGSLEYWEIFFFVLLISLVVIAIKYMRDGFFMIFKFETTHAGVNQWGSGIFALVRALFLASLIMYGILLTRIEYLQRQAISSVSQKLALKAAPNTYSFLFNNVIGKVLTRERFNDEVLVVVSHNSVARKSY